MWPLLSSSLNHSLSSPSQSISQRWKSVHLRFLTLVTPLSCGSNGRHTCQWLEFLYNVFKKTIKYVFLLLISNCSYKAEMFLDELHNKYKLLMRKPYNLDPFFWLWQLQQAISEQQQGVKAHQEQQSAQVRSWLHPCLLTGQSAPRCGAKESQSTFRFYFGPCTKKYFEERKNGTVT